eukprot:11197592-Lingulodinium_polyedra.AAC.1
MAGLAPPTGAPGVQEPCRNTEPDPWMRLRRASAACFAACCGSALVQHASGRARPPAAATGARSSARVTTAKAAPTA